jgi:hypothetical protein
MRDRQRLTDYARIMNSSAGDTGLTTHDILWGDSIRATPPEGVPASASEFKFTEPLAIDRYKLAELRGAGKALDDHASAMGAFADPAQQPWRGVGNLNLSRFDRNAAINAAAQWASALEQLQSSTRAVCETAYWEDLSSPGYSH